MPLTSKQREQIVCTAREWLGTPYHHRAALKGAGADCALFPLAVYRECGVIPEDYEPPEYSSQWHLHRSEELYLREIDNFADEIHTIPRAADFIVIRFGRTFSHGAIVVAWPTIIHSYIPHGVTLADALRDGAIIGRETKFFAVKGSRVDLSATVAEAALKDSAGESAAQTTRRDAR